MGVGIWLVFILYCQYLITPEFSCLPQEEEVNLGTKRSEYGMEHLLGTIRGSVKSAIMYCLIVMRRLSNREFKGM